jgi:hypothetical protein
MKSGADEAMNQQESTLLPKPGTSVAALVSDPWEAVDKLPSNPFTTQVISVGHDGKEFGALLLRVVQRFSLQNKQCEYFVATRRHAEPKGRRRKWEECPYNLTRVSAEQAQGPSPFEDKWLPGEVGLIATLTSTAGG